MKAAKVLCAKTFFLLGLATEMKLLSAIDEGWGFMRVQRENYCPPLMRVRVSRERERARARANRWRFFGLRVQLGSDEIKVNF